MMFASDLWARLRRVNFWAFYRVMATFSFASARGIGFDVWLSEDIDFGIVMVAKWTERYPLHPLHSCSFLGVGSHIMYAFINNPG